MDRGAWRATVHAVKESDMTERLTHVREKERECYSAWLSGRFLMWRYLYLHTQKKRKNHHNWSVVISN